MPLRMTVPLPVLASLGKVTQERFIILGQCHWCKHFCKHFCSKLQNAYKNAIENDSVFACFGFLWQSSTRMLHYIRSMSLLQAFLLHFCSKLQNTSKMPMTITVSLLVLASLDKVTQEGFIILSHCRCCKHLWPFLGQTSKCFQKCLDYKCVFTCFGFFKRGNTTSVNRSQLFPQAFSLTFL
jgi:hypothetical protein